MGEMFGYEVEELTDKKAQDLVFPEDWPLVRDNLARRLSGDINSVRYDFRGLRKDGAIIYLEVFGSRTDYHGKPAVIGTSLDRTERHKMETELRESEARYRALVELAPVSIVVHERGIIRFVNRMMADALEEKNTDELVGRHVLDLVHPVDLERVSDRIKKSGEGAALPPTDEKLVTRTGKVIDASLRTAPITYLGRPCTMAIIQDISDRKKAEAAILELNAGLEKRVERRTAQLSQANRDLEAFNSMVSHDLRAPLRHLKAFAELLRDSPAAAADAEAGDHARKIVSTAEKMSTLLDDLLSFSRAGRAELRHAPVDLAELVDEAREELRADCGGRKIVWDVRPLPVVSGDRILLRQVIVNLLSNAIKYTRDRSEARVEVSARRGGAETAVSVRDNGVGFDPETAGRLFEPFQRLESARGFPGSGVGLAIVARIVTRHGGRVWAESLPGRWASFSFSLPDA
jgi:PAS domain S-box-containing protein